MSRLYGIVVTDQGIAANNRGENEGNITTLQKILWNNELYTTVSAEAIRFAIRYYWQMKGYPVNRVWNEELGDHNWQDKKWLAWTSKDKDGEVYVDDDVLGFMLAEAAGKDGSSAKGSCDKRRGILEVTRALSLTPFNGEITFNSVSGEKGRTSIYGTEVHATRYQYGFAMTPGLLRDTKNVEHTIDAIVSLTEVGGNHSRFFFDFSPDSIIFRWTDDFSPRMLYGFELDESGNIAISKVLEKIQSNDIKANELVIGGTITKTLSTAELEILSGAHFCPGVVQAAEAIKEKVKNGIR